MHAHGGYLPTQPVPQGNQTGQSPLGSGRCGWGGLLAVLTAILGRGSTVVGGYQDVVNAVSFACTPTAARSKQYPLPAPPPQHSAISLLRLHPHRSKQQAVSFACTSSAARSKQQVASSLLLLHPNAASSKQSPSPAPPPQQAASSLLSLLHPHRSKQQRSLLRLHPHRRSQQRSLLHLHSPQHATEQPPSPATATAACSGAASLGCTHRNIHTLVL